MARTTTNKKSAEEHGINKLSILVSQDGLCFCGSFNREIRAFHHLYFTSKKTPVELLKAMQSPAIEELLRTAEAQEAEVEVFYAHALFTLVPLPYFDEKKVSDYLKYNVRLLETDDLAFDKITGINANLIYIPYVNINNFIFERFGAFTFRHTAAPFITRALDIAKDSHLPEVFLEVFSSHFMLSVVQNGNLLLCNDFDYQTPEDLIYYLLFTFKQLELNNETLKLHLSGALDKGTPTYDLLETYIRHIHFVDAPTFKISSLKDSPLNQLPRHRFQLLLTTI